jgi:Concanavalin A-like lectin/glucanases superfamily
MPRRAHSIWARFSYSAGESVSRASRGRLASALARVSHGTREQLASARKHLSSPPERTASPPDRSGSARKRPSSPHGRTRRRRGAIVLALLLLVPGIAVLRSPSSGSAYDAAVLEDHPVAFWAMTASARTEADLTGNGHTGKYERDMAMHVTMPNGDSAASFDGHGQYLSVASSSVFSITTTQKLTWEAWIRPALLHFTRANDPSQSGYVSFIGKCQHYSPSCEWAGRMYSSVNSERRCSRLSAYAFNPQAGLGAGAHWQPACNLLQAGQWLYVVGEYETSSTPSGCKHAYPGTIGIWVNGVKWNPSYHSQTGCMSQYDVSPRPGGSPLNVGTVALDSFFPGAIGKVAIYDTLLSQAEIDSHFTTMTGANPTGSCSDTCTIPVPTPTPALAAS